MTRSYSPLRHQQNQPEPLAYRHKEAALAIGVCETTLRNLRDRGEIPYVRHDWAVLYPVSGLRRWLEDKAEFAVDGKVCGEEQANRCAGATIGAVEQATTRVVHWRDREQYPEWVYVGRPIPRQRIKGSPFANPFKIGKDGSRADVLAKYSQWIASQPELIQQARALKGKVLVCWCAPDDCHGHVLARIAEGGEA